MKILVIACHPDDEVIGCGGTIRKHVEQDDIVDVLIITKASVPPWTEQYVEEKLLEQDLVDHILGVHKRLFLNINSLRLDKISHCDFNYEIYKKIELIKPDIIYTHYNKELNKSHNIVGDATLVGSRIPNKTTIYMYESEGCRYFGNSFKPNYYVSLTRNLMNKKIEAMEIYDSEIKKERHPRSIDGLITTSKYRGAEVGIEYAEAFIQVRRLWI